MQVIKRNIKILILILIPILLPLFMLGDGGMPRRECTDIIYYDTQPTILPQIQLELIKVTINGTEVTNLQSNKTITPLRDGGYRYLLRNMDTLYIRDMTVNQENTKITEILFEEFQFDSFVSFIKK